MRRYFLYCSLGLFSTIWLTGCGVFRNTGCECGQPTGQRVGVLQKRLPVAETAKVGVSGSVTVLSEGKAGAMPGAVVGQESVAISAPRRSTKVTAQRPTEVVVLKELPSVPLKALPDAEPPQSQTLEFVDVSKTNMSAKVDVDILPAPAQFMKQEAPVVTPSASVEATTSDPNQKAIAIKGVHFHFGAAEKFASITGQVQEYRKAFRLRYAAVDQEDPYGGVVVLDGGASLSRLSDGRHVRVTGELIPPTDRNGVAHYRVTGLEILD